MDIPVANKTTMKNHPNHQMVQLYLSAVTCLLFLGIRNDVKRESKPKTTLQPCGQKLEHKIIIFLVDEHDNKNCWTGKQQMKAMSLEQSRSIKNCFIFFPLSKFAFRPFQSSVETKSWNRDRFPDKSPVEFQCLDELVIQPQ